MEVDGAFASETLSLSASAGHLIVDHSAGRIDADNIQDVSWVGFGGLDGGDQVAVNDLSSTDVVNFTPDFTDPLDNTGPNNSADQLTVRGTAAIDHITVSGSGANVTVAGLTPTVTPINLDGQDTLRIEEWPAPTPSTARPGTRTGAAPGLLTPAYGASDHFDDACRSISRSTHATSRPHPSPGPAGKSRRQTGPIPAAAQV